MTRLELAKKRAKELEKAQSNITNENTSTTSDTSKTNKRLELAKQRANNLENEYKKAQEQQQKFNDYVSKNGIDDVNEQYKNYIQTGNKIIAPKLYQTQAMQELASKRNATTPSEVKNASDILKTYKTERGIESDKTSNENNKKRTVEYDNSLTKYNENELKLLEKTIKTAQDEDWANSKNIIQKASANSVGLKNKEKERNVV